MKIMIKMLQRAINVSYWTAELYSVFGRLVIGLSILLLLHDQNIIQQMPQYGYTFYKFAVATWIMLPLLKNAIKCINFFLEDSNNVKK